MKIDKDFWSMPLGEPFSTEQQPLSRHCLYETEHTTQPTWYRPWLTTTWTFYYSDNTVETVTSRVQCNDETR